MLSSKHVRVFRKTCTTFWKTRTCFSKDFSYLCPMEKTKRYYEYGKFLQERFDHKVQKISINAGFTCPNRDGAKGWGGCTYCNNQTFSPEYCHTEKSVTEQLEEGVRFFPANIRICGIWPTSKPTRIHTTD